jgi:hypothetical protein
MNTQKNFPKIQLIISMILLLVSVSLFYIFNRALKINNEETQLIEKEWQNEVVRRDEIRQLEYSVKIIEKERAQLETHFAQSSDIVPFLDTIEGLATKVNAKAEVTSVDIMKDKVGLMVGMKASGTFSGLYKFITLLENSPYELEFIGMNMIKKSGLDNVVSKNVKAPEWDVVLRIRLLNFVVSN